jgi:polysaccharide deacetylase family protein (PEP-CTERM system associated)
LEKAILSLLIGVFLLTVLDHNVFNKNNVTNIITIDLEDWHSLTHRRLTGILLPPSPHVFRQVDRLLNILDQHQTKATFFVLGTLAESHPEIVKRLAAQGHEIASHGYSHLPIHKLSPQEFREDTKKSKYLLEDITGTPVTGYRAPEFSIIRETMWALEILAEMDFTYDSSIFPMYHRRYGIYDFPKAVTHYELPNNLKIVEIPLSTFSLGKISWSYAGAGYFRLTPIGLICNIIKGQNDNQIPAVTYFHPYEFDSNYLNTLDVFEPKTLKEWMWCWRGNFHQNLGRRTVSDKISILLKKFRFIPCREYLAKGAIIEARLPGF